MKRNNMYTREVIMTHKSQDSFITGHERPYIWVKDRRGYALSRGCCARDCGCCTSVSGFIPKKKQKLACAIVLLTVAVVSSTRDFMWRIPCLKSEGKEQTEKKGLST